MFAVAWCQRSAPSTSGRPSMAAYGGLEAKRLKALEDENARLKKLLGRDDAGQCHAEGCRFKKMVTPAARREAVCASSCCARGERAAGVLLCWGRTGPQVRYRSRPDRMMSDVGSGCAPCRGSAVVSAIGVMHLLAGTGGDRMNQKKLRRLVSRREADKCDGAAAGSGPWAHEAPMALPDRAEPSDGRWTSCRMPSRTAVGSAFWPWSTTSHANAWPWSRIRRCRVSASPGNLTA